MPLITIGTTPIDFPNSAASPNWAPAIIKFAEAVEFTINSMASIYDVSPQTQTITVYEVDTPITSLSFSPTSVRSIIIFYSIYRKTSTEERTEQGQLEINYNEARTPIWEMVRSHAGDCLVSFDLDASGQIYYNATELTGLSDTEFISFRAITNNNDITE